MIRAHRNVLVVVAVVVLLAVAVTVTAVITAQHDRSRREASPSSPLPSSRTPTGSTSSASEQPLPTATLGVPAFSPAGPPTAAQKTVLARRIGFGGKVTGGAGGMQITVSTDADSGPGSLRAAVSGDQPAWIQFSKDMTIQLKAPLAVGSNKTIDGAGQHVEITGPNIQGLDVIDSSNVIVESLTLHDFGNVKLTARNDLPDAVHIERAHGVWIDHCDLSMAGDKLIGVTTGSTGITVTWSHFHDQEQVFQIGNQATGAQDVDQDVTVADNFFDHTLIRNPVVDYGRAHVFNNYYLDWGLYGVRAERTGQIYLQNNIFAAGERPRAAVVKPGGDGCNDAKSHCDARPGVIEATGNLLLNGAKIVQHGEGTARVFDPAHFYRFDALPASLSLAHTIAMRAGPI